MLAQLPACRESLRVVHVEVALHGVGHRLVCAVCVCVCVQAACVCAPVVYVNSMLPQRIPAHGDRERSLRG